MMWMLLTDLRADIVVMMLEQVFTMKINSLKFTCLCIAIISLLFGCNKEEVASSPQEIIIYGTVIDKETGDPLHNVQVSFGYEELDGDYEGYVGSAVTGSDGSYEFVLSGIKSNAAYYVEAIKYGYESKFLILSLEQNYSGDRVRMDFQLIKK